ncbi:hypothetical protein DIPPA_20446 [Diplonema papillatum]|nr:hypothetical protein DIPPA_20446 [Diplonema papillatum]
MPRNFPWCESRPDGRRAIKNHQEAHGRAIRTAKKVVDTTTPKFFKLRLQRSKACAHGRSLRDPHLERESRPSSGGRGCDEQEEGPDRYAFRILRNHQAFTRSLAADTNRIVNHQKEHILQRPASAAAIRPDNLHSLGGPFPSASHDESIARICCSFNSGQLAAYDSFVTLLAEFSPADMSTILASALQDASEKRLFSQYHT